MRVAVCAIAKQENNYIREWVEHYKNIGFDHVYLYDNNDPKGEVFSAVIGDYINNGYVTIINFRGRKIVQKEAYNDCYSRFGTGYDWIAFLDIDEFLTIYDYGGQVKPFLGQAIFKNYIAVKICWMCMTDSGILSPNGDYSVKKFTQPLSAEAFDNRYAKCIVRTRKDVCYRKSVHFPNGIDDSVCDVLGNPAKATNSFPKTIWNKAIIRHYRCKTIEEYVTNKMQRLYPDHDDAYSSNALSLDFFWRHNERTPEKEAYANELLKRYQ